MYLTSRPVKQIEHFSIVTNPPLDAVVYIVCAPCILFFAVDHKPVIFGSGDFKSSFGLYSQSLFLPHNLFQSGLEFCGKSGFTSVFPTHARAEMYLGAWRKGHHDVLTNFVFEFPDFYFKMSKKFCFHYLGNAPALAMQVRIQLRFGPGWYFSTVRGLICIPKAPASQA